MNPVIQILLALDATKFAAGANQAKSALNSFVGNISSKFAGFASFDFLAGKAQEILRLADSIGDMAAKLGVSTDQIQEFQYAASKTGGSLESFTSALRTLIKTQQDAITGGAASEAFKPFAALGVSFEELKRLSPDQLLYRVGDAFRKSSQDGQQLDAVITLLGRGAMDLMGALKEGLRELAREAHATGQVMNEEVVAGLGAANDQLDRMKQRVTVQGARILSPIWKDVTRQMASGAAWWTFAAEVLKGKSINAAAMMAFRSAAAVVQENLPGPKPPKPGPTPVPDMWSRLGDPGEVTRWKAYATGDERRTALSFGTADALARIGLFRGAYDPGERTRLQMLTELRSLNRSVAQTNRLLADEP